MVGRGARTALLCAAAIVTVLSAAVSTGALATEDLYEDLYLRVGIGFDLPTETVFRDVNCGVEQPLYGCATGGDGALLHSVGDFSTATGFEVGIGGAVAPAVRMEAIIEFRPGLAFSGYANYLAPERQQTVAVDASVLSGMVAAYADLLALGLPRLGPFDPFVGAGVGVARISTGETRMMFPATTTIVPGARRSGLAWMLTAGVATALGESTTLEVAWRYSELGTAETGTGGGRVVWRDESREPLMLDLAPTEARLRSHGLRFSLRQLF